MPPWASAAYVEAVGPLRRRTHNRALQRRADLLIGVRSTITRHNHCFQGCHNHNHDFHYPNHDCAGWDHPRHHHRGGIQILLPVQRKHIINIAIININNIIVTIIAIT